MKTENRISPTHDLSFTIKKLKPETTYILDLTREKRGKMKRMISLFGEAECADPLDDEIKEGFTEDGFCYLQTPKWIRSPYGLIISFHKTEKDLWEYFEKREQAMEKLNEKLNPKPEQ